MCIRDRLYYDSSLTKATIIVAMYHNQEYFKYKDLYLKNPISIFYFENPVYFIGGMWDNIFKSDS